MSTEETPPSGETRVDSRSNFDTQTRYRARVKWFNNRAGYGFATIQTLDRKAEDVFVHHSGITCGAEQYKYLVQGEYVEFNLRPSSNEKHPYQADNIRGVDDGMLMCETHAEVRKQREKDGREVNTQETRYKPRDKREPVRFQGGGPREGEHWYLVKGRRGKGREGGRGGRRRPNKEENVQEDLN